ncbi:hypothetical protein HCJ76_43990 [Streptomyces sp. MC1]|uniref:hypothetical protein n=1 Tax=Streptomyces sp. MC1 TaxID=295105 RepID=UPI0018CB981D|nr:hypothetical protein [Streptomyces sp. MC1]MBG7704845.1 hypothetical protein [Streptomyces sp. MC1]
MTETKPLPVRGRPPLLNADMVGPIARAVEEGKTRAEAAAAAGVLPTALSRWLHVGRRLRDSGVDSGSLRSHEWMCLHLLKTVEAAEARRDEQRFKGQAAAAEPPKAVGRPPLLSARLVDTVVRSLASGSGRAVAAAAAGVTLRTLQRWLARGAQAHYGTARTEYERLCAQLYVRAREAEKTAAAAEGEPGPVLETKGLLEPVALPNAVLEPHRLKLSGPPMILGPGTVIEERTDIDFSALPAGAVFKPFSPSTVVDSAGLLSGSGARIASDSIRAETIDPEAVKTRTITQADIDRYVFPRRAPEAEAAERPRDPDIDISRPRGRFRTWLRTRLQRAASAL